MNLGSQSLILFVPSMSLAGMTNVLVRFQMERKGSEQRKTREAGVGLLSLRLCQVFWTPGILPSLLQKACPRSLEGFSSARIIQFILKNYSSNP